MQLEGIAAIVTGGASGLGASTARMLAGRGAQVVVFDLNEPAARDLVRDIGGLFCKVNVNDDSSVLEGLAQAATTRNRSSFGELRRRFSGRQDGYQAQCISPARRLQARH
jgi:NAD(P)-dependent dehydrogenase (short-subunit alcohol dehydrogenase family)